MPLDSVSCLHCGRQQPADDRYCTQCGSELPSVQQQLADTINSGFAADKFGSSKPNPPQRVEVHYVGWPNHAG